MTVSGAARSSRANKGWWWQCYGLALDGDDDGARVEEHDGQGAVQTKIE